MQILPNQVVKSQSDQKCDARPCSDALLVLRLVSDQSMKSQGGHDQTVRPSWQVGCTWVADVHLLVPVPFCQQVPNHLLLKSSLEPCRRNDPSQGLLALGNPLWALLQQAHTGSAGNSKVRIESKLWSISDMLSPTLGRPPALPWWPDQPRPAGPTPSCAAITRLPATLSLTLELPSGGKAATSSSIILPTSGI